MYQIYQNLFSGKCRDDLREYFRGELSKRGTVKKYRKKQLITIPSERLAFAIVVNGLVSISFISSDGQEKILHIVYSGGIIGEENLFSDAI